MKLKFFVKDDCPNCPPAKNLAEEIRKDGKITVEIFDVDEADGLAEAQFYAVLATPSIVLCDDKDEAVEAWRVDVPKKEAVYNKIL